MTTVQLFLLLAAQLAVLTYNIGVLLYALPVPSRRIKRWAPVLIEDGLYAALLFSLFSLMLYLSDYMSLYSGVTLSQVAEWLRTVMSNIVLLYLSAKIFASALSRIPVVGSFSFLLVLPISLIVYTVVTAMASVLVPIYIIIKLKAELAALGVALYALPFRIGRNAGASLIAFVVIGNVAFHFLPHWVMFILKAVATSTTQQQPHEINAAAGGVYNFWGLITGAAGGHPVYALVEFQHNRTFYTYLTYPDGAYYATYPNMPLPSGIYNVTLEYMGLKVPLDGSIVSIPQDLKLTYELTSAPYRLDLNAGNAVFLPHQGIVTTSCIITKASIGMPRYDARTDMVSYPVTIDCVTTPYTDTVIVAGFPKSCGAYAFIVSGLTSAIDIERRYTPWRGVPASQEIVKFITYKQDIQINFTYVCPRDIEIMKPQIYSSYQSSFNLAEELGIAGVERAYNTLVSAIIEGTAISVAIFSFLTILSALIIGFARFLGASSPRIVFDL